MVENKHEYVKKVMELYMGGTKTEIGFDCITELEKYQNDLYEVGSFPGEYHYLLSRAYESKGDVDKALDHAFAARKGHVIDQKVIIINKLLQIKLIRH